MYFFLLEQISEDFRELLQSVGDAVDGQMSSVEVAKLWELGLPYNIFRVKLDKAVVALEPSPDNS